MTASLDRIQEKISHLRALGNPRRNSNSNEARLAREKAQELESKYGIGVPSDGYPQAEAVSPAPAAPSLVHQYPIAGFQYYEGPRLKHQMHVGDPVYLRAAPTNPHDRSAVEIYWNGHMLGHIPRGPNVALSAELLSGIERRGRILSINPYTNGWGTVEIVLDG